MRVPTQWGHARLQLVRRRGRERCSLWSRDQVSASMCSLWFGCSIPGQWIFFCGKGPRTCSCTSETQRNTIPYKITAALVHLRHPPPRFFWLSLGRRASLTLENCGCKQHEREPGPQRTHPPPQKTGLAKCPPGSATDTTKLWYLTAT